MKYTNKDIIQSGERKLIRYLARHLNWDGLKRSIKENYHISADDNLEHKSGSIVVHKGEIAYHMEFDLKVNVSVLLDRNGESIAIESPQLNSDKSNPPATASDESSTTAPDQQKQADNARKASEIARMISEINE